ncbi:MAG: TlpA family protein disulfide reductase [Acidimicrobiales bacterium]
MTRAEPESLEQGLGRPRRPHGRMVTIGVAVAIALIFALFKTHGDPLHPAPLVGNPAPIFSAASLTGKGQVGIPADGGTAGRPAVILFFSSTCKACRAELPAIARTYREQNPATRVQIIGIDVADTRSAGLALVRSSGVEFPVGVDPGSRITSGVFYFLSPPGAVLVGSNGAISDIVHGQITNAQLLRGEKKLR